MYAVSTEQGSCVSFKVTRLYMYKNNVQVAIPTVIWILFSFVAG